MMTGHIDMILFYKKRQSITHHLLPKLEAVLRRVMYVPPLPISENEKYNTAFRFNTTINQTHALPMQ